MAEPAAAPPAPPAAPPPAPAANWYDGKAGPEITGVWQNKGWDASDAAKVAIEATKAYSEAQKFVGAPPDRLIRLPEKPTDEAGWKAVHQRLGAPADAKEYDFTAVKHADGSAPAESLIDTLRATAASMHLPKDRAAEFATSIVKHFDAAKTEQAAAAAVKLAGEKDALAKSWGPNAEMNKLQAMQGAKRLGITPEAIAALETQIGYAGVMEAMRKIGAGTSEDSFVESKGGGMPTTAGGAQARLTELQSDQAWTARLLKGGVSETREWQQLTAQIAAAA